MTSIIEKIRASEKAIPVAKLAAMLDMSRQTVYDHIERGDLRVLRFGSTIRLDPKDVVEYLEKQYA